MLSGVGLITQALLFLNKGIYWFAEKCYTLLIDLANFELFTSEQYSVFGERIYVLLGVVMLFKLSFSLITYIVNPDAISDKQKGAGVLIKKIIISLLLIVATPFIFKAAMGVQKLVINDNIIPNLILGMGSGDTVEYGSEGEEISFLVFSSFFRPNPAIYNSSDLSSCNATLFAGEKEDEEVGTLEIGGLGTLVMREECAEPLNKAVGTSFDGEISEVVSWAYTDKNINIFTDSDLIKAKSEIDGEKINTFEFHGLVALVCGGFLTWIMFMFCFDIAVRTIKLAFLQIIAPIPIIAYADPKSDKIFKSWMKQCLSTYFDLFIRLIGIFFAVFIIQQLVYSDAFANNNNDSGIFHNALINIFIIFGALLFAKQLPKLIENIIGVKLDGGFTLSPMNKIQQIPLVGAATGSLTSRIAGGVEAARNDKTGHRLRSFFMGGSAAAHEMKGKIPLSGAKPGAATTRSVTDARKIGYKLATGSEMRAFSPTSWLFAGAAQSEHDAIKAKQKRFKIEKQDYEDNVSSAQDKISNFRQGISSSRTRIDELNGLRKTYDANKPEELAKINEIDSRIDSLEKGIEQNVAEIGKQAKIIEENREKIRVTDDIITYYDSQMQDITNMHANVDTSSKKSEDELRRNYEGKTGNRF